VKTRVWVVVALAAAVAWSGLALAREKKERKGKMAAVLGTLNEGAMAGETVTWKITAEDGTDKELPMATNVVVMYSEKNGQNRAMQIRVAGKKVPEAKGKRLVAQGTLKAVAVAGKKATVTVTVDAADKDFALPTKVKIMAREKADGTTQAMAIGPGGGRKKGGGDQPAEGKKKRKKKKGEDAPANM